MATIEYPQISINSANVPIISGTQTKVLMVVMDHISHGWDAKEIHQQYPHLTLGQIHGALTYYYDHKAEMDVVIQQDSKEADRMMVEIENCQNTSELKSKLTGMERLL